jgi:hypothetical protein
VLVRVIVRESLSRYNNDHEYKRVFYSEFKPRLTVGVLLHKISSFI